MKSILEALCDGEIYPRENIDMSNEEYRGIIRSISREEEYWKNKMSPEDFMRFEELGHMYSASFRIEFSETFRYGFSLAVSLLTEAYEYQNKLVRN